MRFSEYFLEFLLIIAFIQSFVKTCPIYLTASSNGKNTANLFLEINWGPGCEITPDWIGLYQEDPSISNSEAIVRIVPGTNSSGYVLTDFKIGKLQLPGGWDKNSNESDIKYFPHGKCLNYFIASFKHNNLLSVNCLKIQPNWMSLSENIPDMKLKDLFIPGTHASGSFFNSPKYGSTLIKNFGQTQNFDIWTQLVFGIRFLDLSIGYRHSENGPDIKNFWIVNENMLITSFQQIINDIKRFAKLSGEIILVNFSSFPIGFYKHPENHKTFLKVLDEEFNDLAFRRTKFQKNVNSYDFSINDIRNTGKGLLITYPFDDLPTDLQDSEIIWPEWKKFSSYNSDIIGTLDFMRLLFTQKEGSPNADGGWIFYGIRGLEGSFNLDKKMETTRERAIVINNKMTRWLGGPWSLTANIVAVDFFMGTNLIEIAIYTNRNKAFNINSKNLTNFDIN